MINSAPTVFVNLTRNDRVIDPVFEVGLRRAIDKFVRSARITVEERRRLHAASQRVLALAGRPRLYRQWYRPRAVGRACGSRHRVMLG